EVARLRDGPQTALNRMRRSGLSGILVVDGERRVLGYLTSERIVAALREGEVTPDRIHRELMEPAATVATDTPLADVITIASEGSAPIAVVDATGRLRGVVVKGAILAALARTQRNGAGEGAGGAPCLPSASPSATGCQAPCPTCRRRWAPCSTASPTPSTRSSAGFSRRCSGRPCPSSSWPSPLWPRCWPAGGSGSSRWPASSD